MLYIILPLIAMDGVNPLLNIKLMFWRVYSCFMFLNFVLIKIETSLLFLFIINMASFDNMFSSQEKVTIQHIARFWEPRVRDFPPSLYLDHYANTKAVCDEIAEIKRQRIQYKKSMTKEERR